MKGYRQISDGKVVERGSGVMPSLQGVYLRPGLTEDSRYNFSTPGSRAVRRLIPYVATLVFGALAYSIYPDGKSKNQPKGDISIPAKAPIITDKQPTAISSVR